MFPSLPGPSYSESLKLFNLVTSRAKPHFSSSLVTVAYSESFMNAHTHSSMLRCRHVGSGPSCIMARPSELQASYQAPIPSFVAHPVIHSAHTSSSTSFVAPLSIRPPSQLPIWVQPSLPFGPSQIPVTCLCESALVPPNSLLGIFNLGSCSWRRFGIKSPL